MPKLVTWGRTFRARPTQVARPTTEAQVQRLVRSSTGPIRAHGALHSWSDVALTDGVAVSLDGLTGITEVNGTRVSVRAGTRLFDLNRMLHEHGLAMPILGSVDHQSLAGAISTGTHGSSRRYGNLATLVRGMRLVTGTGEVLSIEADDERLDALRVGLGATGILTELTIDVVPAFNLRERSYPLPIDEAVERVDELSNGAEFVKIWWLPHTGNAVVFEAERTQAPSEFSRLGRWLDEKLVNRVAFRSALVATRFAPRLVRPVNRAVGGAYFRPRERIGRSHQVFHLAMPPVHREMEYALPVEQTREALAEMTEWVRREALRVNFIAEVRFVRGDPGWMSPAHDQDVCQLGAYMANNPDLAAYFAGFEQRMLARGGRPHWGKEFAAAGATVRSRYPKAQAWWGLVQQLDPGGRFRNRFTNRVFGG